VLPFSLMKKINYITELGDLPFVAGAAGLAMSNPPLLSTMGLFASLEVFAFFVIKLLT